MGEGGEGKSNTPGRIADVSGYRFVKIRNTYRVFAGTALNCVVGDIVETGRNQTRCRLLQINVVYVRLCAASERFPLCIRNK